MTSQYFQNFRNLSEQDLIEDLVIESIHIWGHDVCYIPREGNTPDKVWNEDSSSEYNGNYPCEMYIKSYDGYEGDGTFLAKFGIEIRHQVTFTVAIKTFKHMVGNQLNMVRPLEGDLIYFPLDNKLVVIKKVNKYSVFFQTGALQSYDLVCEVFEYAGEKLNTGIPQVDLIEQQLSLSTLAHALRDINGDLILDAEGKPQFDPDFDMDAAMDDVGADNEELGEEAGPLIDATDDNIMSETF
jgi:hypothetical protein